jgi:SAM-dependent methyltransferase
MKPDASGQRTYYDSDHSYLDEIDLPVERLKQAARLSALVDLSSGLSTRSVLIVGCGSGVDTTVLQAEKLVALDLSWVAVSAAQNGYPSAIYVQADGTQLPFISGSFDVVMCSEVIEHIIDPDRMVDELARVLRPNGRLLLSTPNWISWWGLARKLGECILIRPITSGGQPVDNWFTARRLQITLSRHFDIEGWRGVWYFPPTGLGMRRLPDWLIAPVFRFLMPLDRIFGRFLPRLGHLLAVRALRLETNFSKGQSTIL